MISAMKAIVSFEGGMILVDLVGWIAYFSEDTLGAVYEPLLLETDNLVCSALNLNEVCRRIAIIIGERSQLSRSPR